MTVTFRGPISSSLQRDSDGHRTYKVVYCVLTTEPGEGPISVMQASGLPAVGDTYSYGSESDPYAFCHPDFQITPETRETWGPTRWRVEVTFSTKPLRRCQETNIEDPLLEPPQISGSFVSEDVEVSQDRFGKPITNSAFEPFQGDLVKFRQSRPQVKISMNVGTLDLAFLSNYVNKVNSDTLWGLPKRCVLLSSLSWERLVWGTCSFYYKLNYEFLINPDTFDRDLVDQGTRVLRGFWIEQQDETGRTYYTWSVDSNADRCNPLDYVKWKDLNGDNQFILLDGEGRPLPIMPLDLCSTGTGSIVPGKIHVEYYGEVDFLDLGIPETL